MQQFKDLLPELKRGVFCFCEHPLKCRNNQPDCGHLRKKEDLPAPGVSLPLPPPPVRQSVSQSVSQSTALFSLFSGSERKARCLSNCRPHYKARPTTATASNTRRPTLRCTYTPDVSTTSTFSPVHQSVRQSTALFSLFSGSERKARCLSNCRPHYKARPTTANALNTRGPP